jgi:hypothetical protein
MPIPQGFQRAKIEIDDGGGEIPCALNPESYTVTKSNIWTFKPTNSTDTPKPEFGGGLPRMTHVQLLFDTTLLGPDQSVKGVANDLLKMMDIAKGAPPFVTFTWGSQESWKAAPLSVSVHYTLFHPNGEPIRALVDLELAQADKGSTASSSSAGKTQNPTTRAIRGMRVHRVRDGDSLPSIAYEAYGDATRWRAIAEASGIDDPLSLRRGTELTIPRLEG